MPNIEKKGAMEDARKKSIFKCNNDRVARRLAQLLWCIQLSIYMFFALSTPQSVYSAVFNCLSEDVNCLIDALTLANANSENDTINLEAGTYTLTEVDNRTDHLFDDGGNGLPAIVSEITINGAGSTNTIIARDENALSFRIGRVTIEGSLTLNGVTITGGQADSSGGGLRNDGTLVLINSMIRRNTASFEAGGLENFNGTVFLLGSAISENRAHSNGGGILNSGTMLLINSTVSDNTAQDDGSAGGGGILNIGETLILINSTVSNNNANGDGGGINNDRSELSITDSRITGNSSGSFDGGIRNRGNGQLILEDSIISSNTATLEGGGIHNIGDGDIGIAFH